MIHLIWAQDEFLGAELADRFRGKAAPDEDVVSLDGEPGGVPGLEEALHAPSLFASRRRILVRGAERLNKAGAEALGAALSREGIDAEIAVVAVAERKPTTLVKALEGVAELYTAERPQRREVITWVTKRMKEAGVTPGRDAAATLVERVGSGLRDLAQAIEQLATRTGGKRIERADVESQFAASAEQPAWALFDAVLRRDSTGAYRVLHTLLAHGDDPIPLLFSLVSQVRYVMRARSVLERVPGASDHDLASALGVSSGRAGVLRRQAGRVSWDGLVAAHAVLAEADVELKGGEEGAALPPEIVLERAVGGVQAALG